MYQLTETGVLRLEDNAWIPDCPDNRDWIEYQNWLKEGNTPEPMATPSVPDAQQAGQDNSLSPLAVSNGKARLARLEADKDSERQRLDDTFKRYFQEIKQWLATTTAP